MKLPTTDYETVAHLRKRRIRDLNNELDYEYNAVSRVQRRFTHLTPFFALFLIGNFVLIMAVIGGNVLLETLTSPLWKVTIVVSIVVFSIILNIIIPGYFTVTSLMLLTCIVLEGYKAHLYKHYPLEYSDVNVWELMDMI